MYKKKKSKKSKAIKTAKSEQIGSEDEAKLVEKYEEIWDLDLDKKQIDRLLNIISTKVDQYETNTSDDRKELYRWDDQYEGILAPKIYPYEGCANYHAPITELNVNGMYGRIIKRFRTMDYLRVKAYRDNKDRALLTQRYLRHLFEKKMKYTDLAMTTYRDIIKFGSGVYITTWEYYEKKKTIVRPEKTQKQVGVDPLTQQPIMNEVTEYVIEEQTKFEQCPRIEWVDLCDYFRSEETNRFVEPMWEARRIYASPVEFLHRADKAGYDSAAVDDILKNETEKQVGLKSLEKLDEREIIEWWGWIRLEENPTSQPERIVFTYDRKAKKYLKCMRFPYLFDESNFTVVNLERRTSTWRGRGMCEKLEHVNEEMDKLHDIYIDSAVIVTCKSFKKKRGADTTFNIQDFYPGVVFEVGNMNDLEVMSLGDVPVAPLESLKMLEGLGAKQTGIGSYQTGQDVGPSQPTASGQLAVIQEGNITLDESAKEFTGATIRMARQVLSMTHQFRPEDEFLEVMDEQDEEIINKIPVNIDELIDDPDLIIVDRSVLEEQEFKNQAIEQYNIVRTDPILSQISRIYQASVKNLAVAFKTIDADLLVPTEEELQEAISRHADQVAMADMQKEIAKGQLQMQLAQINAQVQQQKIAAQQQQAEAARQAQASEADKNRQLDLEKQAREQDFQAVQGVIQSDQLEPPAA